MDSSRPFHLIEVLQAIETFCGLCRKCASYIYCVYGHYCIMYWKIIGKIVMLAFFHLLCRFNGLYKLCQDAVQLPGAVLMVDS